MKVVLRIALALIVPAIGAGVPLYFLWWNRPKAEFPELPVRWLEGDVVARYTVTHWKESGKEMATVVVALDFKKAGKYLLENWPDVDKKGELLSEQLIEVSEKELPKQVDISNVGARLELFRMRKAEAGTAKKTKYKGLEKGEGVGQDTPGVNVQYLVLDRLSGKTKGG